MNFNFNEPQECYTKPSPETKSIPERVVDLLLAHFNITFNTELSDKTKSHVKSNYWTLFAHYVIDFFICNFVIAFAVVSFWRGVWDYSLIYLENLLGKVNS